MALTLRDFGLFVADQLADRSSALRRLYDEGAPTVALTPHEYADFADAIRRAGGAALLAQPSAREETWNAHGFTGRCVDLSGTMRIARGVEYAGCWSGIRILRAVDPLPEAPRLDPAVQGKTVHDVPAGHLFAVADEANGGLRFWGHRGEDEYVPLGWDAAGEPVPAPGYDGHGMPWSDARPLPLLALVPLVEGEFARDDPAAMIRLGVARTNGQ